MDTAQPPGPPPGLPLATPAPRATTLRAQGLANRITRTLLATPLVSRLVGRRLITLYLVGRRSGRRMSIPVAYTRDGDALLVGTPFPWGRNLRSGEPIRVRYQGRVREADVQAFRDEAEVVHLYALMARDNRQFASFNRIGLDAAGAPSPEDLHLAWVGGARAFRLTLR
jgi:hypothetical protein